MTEPFINVNRGPAGGPYQCPCCGYPTLAERGLYEICAVCFWEDDGQDDHDADRVRGGPNGLLSLTEARRNFHARGAGDERCTEFVREPMPHEHPLS
ncbi:CPCC family cysteine-rich protein [Streptomyces griseoluteus]|uniref:CPCC family cysteine-rich protein n=1 Tax=Streptomyces griseoluteus TaxID=29306 RepID=UPI00343944A0